MEFLGAFFLLLAIGLTGNPLAIGLMLAAVIYIGGHVSGAHFNPAVTLAVWMRKKIDGMKAIRYVVVQILGAVAACALILYKNDAALVLTPAPGVMPLLAILFEILGTFVLALVVLSVAATKKLEGNFVYGLVIGLTVTALAFSFGPISGGAFNPAVALGPMIIDSFAGGDSIVYLYVYLIGSLIGGALAAVAHKYLNPKG